MIAICMYVETRPTWVQSSCCFSLKFVFQHTRKCCQACFVWMFLKCHFKENIKNDLIWPKKWPRGQISRSPAESAWKVVKYPKVWAKSAAQVRSNDNLIEVGGGGEEREEFAVIEILLPSGQELTRTATFTTFRPFFIYAVFNWRRRRDCIYWTFFIMKMCDSEST